MSTVAFEHVEKIYPNGAVAVADCSLCIEDGELMIFVGPSGCGKSTLLQLVAGLEEPTKGSVRIGDRVVNDLTPQERNVAMVFQDYALYPHMSVRGNLEFPLKMRKMPRAEMRSRVEWVAELLDIGPLLDRRPKELSGGQRQRVAMGRALVRKPTVFLLDEPLSNLDAKLRLQMRAEIGDLQRRTGTTMIYVTHDQVEAMTLGDRVAVLHQGRLRQVAPPRQLYEQPADVFVAGFIGAPPMNLFPVRLAVGGSGSVIMEVCGQRLPIADRAGEFGRYAGAKLTAGIRPESLSLTAADEGLILRATVEQVEPLGHETLAHLRCGSTTDGSETVRLTARVQGMPTLSVGDGVALRVDPVAVHLFDSEGRALAR